MSGLFRLRAWPLVVGTLALMTTTFAGNSIVIDVTGHFISDAEIRSHGGAMKMTLASGSTLVPEELIIARPLGTESEAQLAWYEWRQEVVAGDPDGIVNEVRVEIHGPAAGKGGTLIRSICLEKVWPQSYKVVQLDVPVASPSGGKTQTAFEEILVLRFRNVLRCATPAQ